MKKLWMLPGLMALLFLFSTSYANDGSSGCLNAPKQISWGKGGTTSVMLCGYQNGDVNTSYVQFNNIPRQTKHGCIKLSFEPMDSHTDSDSLTISPNEGVVLGAARSPTTLDVDDQEGPQTVALPIKTDNVSKDNYGFSVSGQSSSVNIKVDIDWSAEDGVCGS